MSRKRRARRKRQANRIDTGARRPLLRSRGALIATAIVLFFSIAVTGGMLARRQSSRRRASGTLSPQTAGTPTKEYVYGANNKIVAIEEPASSSPPPVPTGVVAKPNGSATSILVSWSPSSGATSYTVQRRLTTGDQSPVTLSTTTTSVIDNVPLGPVTTYLYYVSANGSGGTSSAYSTLTPTSFATSVSFVFSAPTATLTPNSVISAAHINQIRAAIDAVRRAAGLSNFSYSYSISPGSTIQANDIVDVGSPAIQSMRTAITQAYTRPIASGGFGFSTPTFTNSINPPSQSQPGSIVKFADYSDFSGYGTSDGLVRGLHP